jgi:hypothetical protein
LYFDLPAADVRENFVIGYWPSMRQSAAITKDAYYAVHGLLLSIPYPEAFPNWLVTTLDYALIVLADANSFAVPPFLAWQHEEWHRAVMSRRGIDSTNDVYELPFGQGSIAVSHVRDEDLERLKRDHPADQVRLSAAGIESDFARHIELDKDRFFFETRAATLFLQWLGTVNAIGYMGTAASSGSDDQTLEFMESEGDGVEVRDFTGLDPTGWVYDLFRPDEAYSARGVHPSGVGIDRYRSHSDLTPRERRYLRHAARLSLLNLVDPQLFGFYQFDVGKVAGRPLAINASLHSTMTSFGTAVGLNLFAKTGPYKLFGTLQAQLSEKLVLPSISAELIRYQLPWFEGSVTPRARLWLQPKDRRFDANEASLGGALEARLNAVVYRGVELYVEGAAKSEGWMMGNEFSGESLNLRTGVEGFVF